MDNSVKTFTHISEFLDYLGNDFTGLTSEMRANLDQEPTFAFNCSKHYADLIKNSAEPVKLLREVLPSTDELKDAPGFVDDPVGDLPAGKSECILQKYENRALIVSTSACGVRCRFCFRRNYPFQDTQNIASEVSNWLDVHTSIWEVILSGGDPLTLGPGPFRDLVEAIAFHPSVTTPRNAAF